MSGTHMAVVVGGGASGALATVQLLAEGWPVVLVDPAASPGRGVAYGTTSPWHLLNSPVDAMSASPDRPDDFLRWCRMRCPDTQPSHFVPRGWYGEYLSETLRRADSGRLTMHRATVSRIFDAPGGGFTVLLSDGVVIRAAHVVLALGNAAPADPLPLPEQVRRSASYIADPRDEAALAAAGDGPVLLIGTGLTAYDVALTLTRTAPGIRIVAVSRHGLTPQPHRREMAKWRQAEPPAGGSLRHLVRALRTQAANTGNWQAVMDSYRPHWNRWWDGLSEPEQRRFLRHLARFWDVHRHRVAPAVADRIAGMREAGTLWVAAGEVCGLAADRPGPGLVATVRFRDAGIARRRFSTVVNCTGPGRIVESSPMVRSLIADGIARPGPYHLGLDTDAHGALMRRDGSANRSLWTLGPPRRGVLWETTAVPEIRAQAQALAQRLTRATVAADAPRAAILRCSSPFDTEHVRRNQPSEGIPT